MKTLILLGLLLCSGSVLAGPPCALAAMERQLVQFYGLAPVEARAYRAAFETFVVNLDLDSVPLTKPVTEIDLAEIRRQLVEQYGLTDLRADYLVETMTLVRMTVNQYGITPENPSCLGQEARHVADGHLQGARVPNLLRGLNLKSCGIKTEVSSLTPSLFSPVRF
jgi:hypothetical protein